MENATVADFTNCEHARSVQIMGNVFKCSLCSKVYQDDDIELNETHKRVKRGKDRIKAYGDTD